MRFKIDWASLIAGNKSTIFALFYFIFEGNFLNTSPQGAYIRRGLSTKGNLRFKLDWASLILGSKFTVFAHCFTLYTPYSQMADTREKTGA